MTQNAPDEKAIPLELRTPDYVASAAKSILGAAPFAGSLLVEIAGTIIPNQRVDRIAKFAAQLEKTIFQLQYDLVRTQLTDENFTDLLEESVHQAARSVTDERRTYIASLVTHSISTDSIKFIESKHLLRILSEINDIEVLWLRFYLDTRFQAAVEEDGTFRKRHADVFDISREALGTAEQCRYKSAMKDSYLQHLSGLGLLSPKYRVEDDSKMPNFDRFQGEFELRGYNLTILGRLLLRHIGLMPWETREA